MDLAPPWDEGWDALQEAFVVLRQRILTDRPGYEVGFSAMPPGPYMEFLGTLSVSADPMNQEFEDLVLSLQCAVAQGGAANVLTFIVEHGDGSEIAKLPSAVLPADPIQRREITLRFVRDVVAFIEGHVSLLLSSLPSWG